MREIKIKPKVKGVLVRDPITREPLKANGEMKPRNTYWLRRVQDASVVLMDDKQKGVTKS
ncbi:DUF2635 domain-containing protein [Aliivibrio logei]|uniref:DUF2635 domain-containing protein n=1 Tax=Aliivibrio logei TaxID=688 RepID=A0A1B9NTE7_ALILO|nr:DUF2635 domain-containing protein [Aliivibrio logei]OCH16991.1 DUF2635 domain-containing protein [Aliivibrio logei]